MAQDQNQQVVFLPEGAKRTRGRDAQRINILIARAVAQAVKSTLGPKGMDKMIVDDLGDVTSAGLLLHVHVQPVELELGDVDAVGEKATGIDGQFERARTHQVVAREPLGVGYVQPVHRQLAAQQAYYANQEPQQ